LRGAVRAIRYLGDYHKHDPATELVRLAKIHSSQFISNSHPYVVDEEFLWFKAHFYFISRIIKFFSVANEN